MWRARQAQTINAQKPGVIAAWKRLTFIQQMSVIMFFGLVFPFLILFGGLTLLAVWDAITAR